MELSTLAAGYWPAATLIAAVRLGVFDALAPRPRTLDDLSAELRAPTARLTALLDALVAIGLLRSGDGAYAIAPDAAPLLSRSSPTCMIDALTYNADLYRHWMNLAEVIRGDGAPAGRLQLGDDPAATRRFVLGMDAKARAFVPAIAAAIDLTDMRTLLDVGSGPGTLTRRLLDDYPHVRATLLDLPSVLAIAKDVCAASPVIDRLSFHPADYRSGPLPAPFDAIVYSGALHQETPEGAADLFRRVRQTLHPGGRLFVIDLMLAPDRAAPMFSALFQLNMLLLRPDAHVFAVDEAVALLDEAGFASVIDGAITETPYHLIRATA